jgi:hypothetical protein
MKKNVLVFGLIAGTIVSAFMVFGMNKLMSTQNYDGSMVLGYASMIIAFSFVFVGIKNYRDKYLNGSITFGKAFMTGLWITLIASTMYVIVWAIDYHYFLPDFMDKYSAHMVEQLKSSGLPQAEMDAKLEEMKSMKEMYKNPVWFSLFTYLEILPVGLLISLISSLILKRKEKTTVDVSAA